MVFCAFFFRLALNLSCLYLQDAVNKLDQIYLESVYVCLCVLMEVSKTRCRQMGTLTEGLLEDLGFDLDCQ